MQMYEDGTSTIREPCTHCNSNHDPVECVRPQHDETDLFDACYEYATYRIDNGDPVPTPRETLEAVLDRKVDEIEVESLGDIAEDALVDAERDA